MRIQLTTEGTYPFHRGGVSTWVDALVRGLPEHEFELTAVASNPHVAPQYPLPVNVSLTTIPLWGSERLDEYVPISSRLAPAGSASTGFDESFLPAVDALVRQMVTGRVPADALVEAVGQLADFAERHDLRAACRDPRVWELLRARLLADPELAQLSMADALDVARSLYRFLAPLAAPSPDVDVAHTSAAALCALPAMATKLRRGVPLVLTEHGIYVRERVLDLVNTGVSRPRKRLLSNFYRGLALVTYSLADTILPVCRYNAGWEELLGADRDRIDVIYNGVDPRHFPPSPQPDNTRPTVVFVGRLHPLKGISTLVAAAEPLRRSVPDVLIRIIGPTDDETYVRECREQARALGVEDAIRFEGATDDARRAYGESDVVVLPSISEGFPYSAVEAMMSARPLVATEVGGVPEALNDTSLVVPPRDPQALADVLAQVLRLPPGDRAIIGESLRERALAHFTQEQFLESYRDVYASAAGERARELTGVGGRARETERVA